MSRFDHLMQEDIQYRRLVGTNATGGKTYDPPRGEPPATIKGRLEERRSTFIDKSGANAVSNATLYTTHPVKEGDIIINLGGEWTVKHVAAMQGLYGGKIDHWEVKL